MTNLETNRLTIRNFRDADAGVLHEIIESYRATGYAVYDYPWPSSAEEIQGVVRWFASADSYLAVCLKETGRLIGLVSLNLSEEPGEPAFDLGYVFHSSCHGHGYATEACQALIAHAFTTLGAEKITCGTAALNQPSVALLARLGFKLVGHGRTSFQQDEQGNPIEFDGCLYELTRAEWVRR